MTTSSQSIESPPVHTHSIDTHSIDTMPLGSVSTSESTVSRGPREGQVGLAGSILWFATVVAGLSAGFFFTYQASVVLGLDEVDDVTYVKTFQAINATIRNPAFAIVFFGVVPATALALVMHRRVRGVAGRWVGAGLLLAVLVVGITFAGSVPLNNELAGFTDLTPQTAAQARADFEGLWNNLNLARTLASVGAFACLAVALRRAPRSSMSR